MLRTNFHQFQVLFELNIIRSSGSICLIFASKIITLSCNYVNQFSLSFFLDFSHRRPPPVSDHFVVHQEWSLTRALTVVKMLLKDHIQNKRALYKRQKGKNTHTRATLTQTYLKKRNHNETNKGDRGEQREGRHAHSSKANSEPKKTVVQPTKATEGEQREGIHTHSSQKKKNRAKETTVQPTKASEGDTFEGH